MYESCDHSSSWGLGHRPTRLIFRFFPAWSSAVFWRVFSLRCPHRIPPQCITFLSWAANTAFPYLSYTNSWVYPQTHNTTVSLWPRNPSEDSFYLTNHIWTHWSATVPSVMGSPSSFWDWVPRWVFCLRTSILSLFTFRCSIRSIRCFIG